MKTILIFLLLIVISPVSHARAVRSMEMEALVEQSALVFVGRIKSVEASGITTELTYPTWKGVVFEWLKVEVEVLDSIKGTKDGSVVRTLMLSTRGSGPMFNSPGTVEPKIGQHHLLCLLPSTFEGVYTSITAPFDDDQGIFLLNRDNWTRGAKYYKDGKACAFQEQNEKNAALWSMVDAAGKISPEGAKLVRKKYSAQIDKPAADDAVIHLKWKKEESESGWQWNVPDTMGDK